MKLSKAAAGNKKLVDFHELKEIVVEHRTKTRLIPLSFNISNDKSTVLDEFI